MCVLSGGAICNLWFGVVSCSVSTLYLFYQRLTRWSVHLVFSFSCAHSLVLSRHVFWIQAIGDSQERQLASITRIHDNKQTHQVRAAQTSRTLHNHLPVPCAVCHVPCAVCSAYVYAKCCRVVSAGQCIVCAFFPHQPDPPFCLPVRAIRAFFQATATATAPQLCWPNCLLFQPLTATTPPPCDTLCLLPLVRTLALAAGLVFFVFSSFGFRHGPGFVVDVAHAPNGWAPTIRHNSKRLHTHVKRSFLPPARHSCLLHDYVRACVNACVHACYPTLP